MVFPSAVKSSWGIFAKLKFTVLLFFIIMIFANAIIISIQQKNIEVGIREVGDRLIFVSNNLEKSSQVIIDNKGIILKTTSDTIANLYMLLESLFIIYFWIKVFYWLFLKVVFRNESFKTQSFLSGFIAFILIEFIVCILNNGGKFTYQPIQSFITFGKAMILIITPAADIAKKIIPGG